ncbi:MULTISPECIES: J domain-containing protein [unclassified Leptolyngbya]|uniref:J domain-containing protein n=1 Tax=unclassified Leptolyngbya TaxID=2650499 RepID=UPI0016867A1D|nr:MULTISPECIES: J domain-containing protein [unclassified Leptolyngbya]MBD1913433.1 DnaJ domain-containing protein [Leptolyngbya sp. FACHB-8]MBD2155828.1 DnaJ domain-containing protein [Leptolyngbya sp. FACHB-16]
MLFKIEQGLFTAEFTDYHAVLGVPVDAEPKDIRKHYLKLARRLHPDSCAKESESDRKRAAEFLSKMVNPAYEKLSDEKNYTEYQLLLKLKGQQALRQQDTIMLSSDVARKLATERGAIEAAYQNALKSLASEQYHHLDRTLELTGQISELNMIYLMRKASEGDMPAMGGPRPAQSAAAGTAATGSSPAATAAPTATAQKTAPTRESIVASYLRRAQEFENKQNYTAAIKELRDGLQIDPQNGTTHCRLGVVYMKANQATMAKIHFRKALEINPQDTVAQQGMKRLDPNNQSAAAAPQHNAPAKGAKTPPKSGKSEGGGLFGLFGGKKK